VAEDTAAFEGGKVRQQIEGHGQENSTPKAQLLKRHVMQNMKCLLVLRTL